MAYGALPGMVLIDPATNEPYKAEFTSVTVEGGMDTSTLATSAKQDSQLAATEALFDALSAPLDVNVLGTPTLPSGSATGANQVTEIQRLDSIYSILGSGIVVSDGGGSLSVDVVSVPLAAGAASSDDIATVVDALTEDLSVTFTNSAISVNDGGGSLTVDGSITVANASIPVTDNGGSLTVDGAVSITNQSIPVTGTVAISELPVVSVSDGGGSLTVDGAVTVANASLAVTAASLPLPAGAATSAAQTSGNAALDALVARNGDVTASGAISTQNLVPAGVATANSAVEITVAGRDALNIQTVGTYTGALSAQGTVNGTTWVTLSGNAQFINLATGAASATIASGTQGIFQSGVGGFQKIRITGLAAVTGSVTVSLLAVDGNAMVALDAPIPAGTAVIGAVTQSGTWAVTATPALPTSFALESANTTNATVAKASGGTLYTIWASNPTVTAAYLKLYNKASAPTVGTDTPIRTIPVPAGSDVSVNFGEIGTRFGVGIGYALTGAAIKGDTTAAVAGVQIGGAYV